MFFKKSKEILFFLLIIFSGIDPLKANSVFDHSDNYSQSFSLTFNFVPAELLEANNV